MDETNKRINNMVAEGLEKAGLASDTKLSGGCSLFGKAPRISIIVVIWIFDAPAIIFSKKGWDSAFVHGFGQSIEKQLLCQLLAKCMCAYPEARVRLAPTESNLVANKPS